MLPVISALCHLRSLAQAIFFASQSVLSNLDLGTFGEDQAFFSQLVQ